MLRWRQFLIGYYRRNQHSSLGELKPPLARLESIGVRPQMKIIAMCRDNPLQPFKHQRRGKTGIREVGNRNLLTSQYYQRQRDMRRDSQFNV
jgi:hypothetical protein